ncbi:hypothetical protein ACWJJH_00565 [Endozoicomonadaceae bacterium StTr2]
MHKASLLAAIYFLLSPCVLAQEDMPMQPARPLYVTDDPTHQIPVLPLFEFDETTTLELTLGPEEEIDTAFEIEERRTLDDLSRRNNSSFFEHMPEPLNEFRLRYRVLFD